MMLKDIFFVEVIEFFVVLLWIVCVGWGLFVVWVIVFVVWGVL